MDDYLARIMGYANQGRAPFGALATTPPQQDEMTRALPDYASRDPNELAMMRHREMVRPQAGRADFPIEHLANMGQVAAGAALAPEFWAGRGIATAFQHAPKLTGAAGAVGAAMLPMAAGAEEPEQIKQLQTVLREFGYRGPIDGRMGPETQRAIDAKRQADQIRQQQELEAQKLRIQGGANDAARETALANQKAADAKLEADRLQAERDAADRARKLAGDERMKELEKNISPMSRAIRDYSGPAGLVGGAILGMGSRLGLTSANNAFAKARALEGNAIMGEEVAGKGAAANLGRVARANDFWRAGGAKEVPFQLTPGEAPGFAANPKVTPLASTYSPKVHPAVEATATAIPASEATWAHMKEQESHDELNKAMDAASSDPSEVNIQRIQKAKDNVALYGGLSNAGRVWAGSQLVGAIGSRFMASNPALRPGMAPAENEQLALQKVIRDAAERSAKAAKKASPESVVRSPQVGVPPAMTGPSAARARQNPGLWQ